LRRRLFQFEERKGEKKEIAAIWLDTAGLILTFRETERGGRRGEERKMEKKRPGQPFYECLFPPPSLEEKGKRMKEFEFVPPLFLLFAAEGEEAREVFGQ